VKALRRIGDRQASDERILGGGDFVEQVTGQIDLEQKYRLTAIDRMEKAQKMINEICEAKSISIEALKGGSRIAEVSKVRSDLALQLVREFGLTLSESARQLGVCTSAIAKIIKRQKGKYN
jgi:hypothetical protein